MSMSNACWNADGALGEAPLSSEHYACLLSSKESDRPGHFRSKSAQGGFFAE